MAGLVPYVHFAGVARAALTFYSEVFGGDLTLHTFSDFGRTDGPRQAIAHGILSGPVDLFGADVAETERAEEVRGVLFSLLGTADPATMSAWFAALSVSGTVVDPLREREWGDHEGQVTDRFGLSWLIGFHR